MPHKMNARSLRADLRPGRTSCGGHLAMVAALAGDQWNEGDVSCSVVRRVALPDAFFATDGLFETLLTVLDELGVFPAVIDRELRRYLPFLATTKVLMAAVRAGRRPRARPRGHQGARGRGRARACGRRASTPTTCSTGSPPTSASGSTRPTLRAVVAEPIEFVGAAPRPGGGVRRRASRRWSPADPDAAAYDPAQIL